ncbi:hypothetical protein HLH26_08845 [Gluconacetobacter sp. 1b LMG 1731]|uniref:Uncharacterized protein n=1 Tax=Gluconacetobacter dulcium TaxID=2729096 RepID=A0A7W4IKR4_9PROT|nr:hypothetical protein [Gluconacetobacter dulcium]MBB2164647.1 hypothetical protein [Gluconacetobacter dulcium]MBB2193783.1 hypothetical protein [Gluconacetobacter dulcium]
MAEIINLNRTIQHRSRMSVFVGYLTVDWKCHAFAAETKRECMRQIALFICEMDEMHRADVRDYPEVAALRPYYYSGVVASNDICRIASLAEINPDRLDAMFVDAIDAYLVDPDVRITSHATPVVVPVHGVDFGNALHAAFVESESGIAGHVSTKKEAAQVWMTDYVRDQMNMTLPQAERQFRNWNDGFLDVVLLRLSPNLQTVVTLASLTPTAG